jgi:hypothetical protein
MERMSKSEKREELRKNWTFKKLVTYLSTRKAVRDQAAAIKASGAKLNQQQHAERKNKVEKRRVRGRMVRKQKRLTKKKRG